MSDLELNKKSASEIIQIDPIVRKTPKVHGDTNQETRQATVQLNIVEDDENVTSEPCCADCFYLLKTIFFGLIIALVSCSIFAGYLFLIYYLISLNTTASDIFGGILAFPLLVACICAKESEGN